MMHEGGGGLRVALEDPAFMTLLPGPPAVKWRPSLSFDDNDDFPKNPPPRLLEVERDRMGGPDDDSE